MSQERPSMYTSGYSAPGMFHRAHGFMIKDSVFMDITNIDTTGEQSIFDSEERGLASICLQGTAQSSLQRIRDWSYRVDAPPVLWLTGPMGTGKSSIAQTIAVEWTAQNRPVATFFFTPQVVSQHVQSSRVSWKHYISNFLGVNDDVNRESERVRIPVVLTLAYQLCMKVPALRGRILSTIHDDPSLQNAKMSKQFEQLIVDPLRDIYLGVPLILLIDALDECKDPQTQMELLEIVSFLSTNTGIKFLISSRPEGVIADFMYAMNDSETGRLHVVSLERTAETDSDIAFFLSLEFSKIRAYTPTFQYNDADIWQLVNRASGQFVFASTVVKYVGEFSSNPRRQLDDIVTFTVGETSSNPFQNLDALYFTILENSGSSLRILPRILGYIMASGGWLSLHQLDVICSLTEGDSFIALRPLRSLLHMPDSSTIRADHSAIRRMPVWIHHASFQEFLVDKARSKIYYVDLADIYGQVFTMHYARWMISFYQLAADEALGYQTSPFTGNSDEVQAIIDIFPYDILVENMRPKSFVIYLPVLTTLPTLVMSMLRFWYAIVIIHFQWDHFKQLICTRYFRMSMCFLWPLFLIGSRWHPFGEITAFSLCLQMIFNVFLYGYCLLYPTVPWRRFAANIGLPMVLWFFQSPGITLIIHYFVRLPFLVEVVRGYISSFAVTLYMRHLIEDILLETLEGSEETDSESFNWEDETIPPNMYLNPTMSSEYF